MKIFNISYHRNATTSFHNFMSSSGYKSIHDMNTSTKLLKLNNNFNMDIPSDVLFRATSIHDVFSDNPWPILYKLLDKSYPDAKFILFYRNSDKWCNSIEKYFGNVLNPFRRFLYKNKRVIEDRQFYIDTYNNHNKYVKEYFKDSDKLLVIDLDKDTNIHTKIYEFIGHVGKKTLFPFNNDHFINK